MPRPSSTPLLLALAVVALGELRDDSAPTSPRVAEWQGTRLAGRGEGRQFGGRRTTYNRPPPPFLSPNKRSLAATTARAEDCGLCR